MGLCPYFMSLLVSICHVDLSLSLGVGPISGVVSAVMGMTSSSVPYFGTYFALQYNILKVVPIILYQHV